MGKKSKANNNNNKQANNNTNGNNKQKKISKSESKVEENTFTEEQLKIHRENVVKLTKDLAATDEGFRTRAAERFPTFLKETKFNKLDLDTNFIDFRKLWKGALYGFWLCDGEFKQHEMAQLLAECIHHVKGGESSPHELPIAFLRAFFDELFETWPRLDKHRMDKYLMLVRKVMQQAFVFLNKTAQYKLEAVEEFIEFILEDGIFNNEERKLLASLQIHIAELFFLELVQYGGPQVENDSDYHLNEDALMKFVQFFIKDFASTENNSIKKTYKEEMFDLLAQYQSVEGESKPEEEEEEEETEENGDAMEDDEDDDEDLPLDEFGNVRQIVKDRPLPVNIERIVKEFEKYKTGYENSDVCVEYYEKFKTRIITLDDLYSELEEVETTVSQKEQAKIERKKKQQEKKAQQVNENKKPQEKKQQPEKKQTEKKVETTPQEKKQKKDNSKATEQKKKEEEEKKKQEKLEQERLEQEKKVQLEKEQKEREEAAAEEKKRNQLLSKVKSVKKLLKDKKPITSTATSSEEKQEKKKVIIDLEKNQVKTFNKKDIVPSLPVDLTFSPTKGLLKTKQDKKRSSDSSDNSQRSSKKRK
ncbi:predicted protein [Naegleria gruberi]|uniref:Predicted protein n=1 Tax=Naegleria gruberi TaxID=5762 RepID=D2VAS0_NAEGR|nr:uncharacterized protein NAEGRDRAFT_48025 [Naegleria gruberi]EFC46128.1 predicted protein [Naegleria gruberi]|eukprot:XP_002678872.1 predicted protein [Naegleria gruberi strain NEG-M]